MPVSVVCNGETFTHVETFKHDFFAATGLYRGADGRLAVLKLGRQTEFLTLPMAWLARFLTRREAALYRLLDGTPGIPRYIGTIRRDTGMLHEFVPGRPLGRDEQVADDFFARLQALLADLHGRDIAYVDLNKRQNILLGDDGRPYLIDFQISLHRPAGRRWPPRWLLARFQQGDAYHVLKHKRRLRPDQLTADERQVVERLSFWIRLHRSIARPLTELRRRILRRLGRGQATDVAGASAK